MKFSYLYCSLITIILYYRVMLLKYNKE